MIWWEERIWSLSVTIFKPWRGFLLRLRNSDDLTHLRRLKASYRSEMVNRTAKSRIGRVLVPTNPGLVEISSIRFGARHRLIWVSQRWGGLHLLSPESRVRRKTHAWDLAGIVWKLICDTSLGVWTRNQPRKKVLHHEIDCSCKMQGNRTSIRNSGAIFGANSRILWESRPRPPGKQIRGWFHV